MISTYIAVGSNLGERESLIQQAQKLIEQIPATRFLRTSKVYETEPVGGPPQGKYLNAVWEIETNLAAGTLLQQLLAAEKELGRLRNEPNGPRTIDLDILFYGDARFEISGLKIPHPRLHERAFVLQPLMDLCPEKVHPGLKQSIRELWQSLKNPGIVQIP